MTKDEQETIILWNNQDKKCEIYTCDKSLISKLDKIDNDDIKVIRKDDISKTYVLPKKWIKVKAPMNLSEDERELRRNRFKK